MSSSLEPSTLTSPLKTQEDEPLSAIHIEEGDQKDLPVTSTVISSQNSRMTLCSGEGTIPDDMGELKNPRQRKTVNLLKQEYGTV